MWWPQSLFTSPCTTCSHCIALMRLSRATLLSLISSNLSSEHIIAQDAAPGPPPPLPSPTSIVDASIKSDPTTLAAALSEALQLLNTAARPLVLGGSYLHQLQWAGVGDAGETTIAARSAQGIAPLIALLDCSGYGSARSSTHLRKPIVSLHRLPRCTSAYGLCML